MAPDGGILVTGASRGIGAAIAVELAARGRIVGCLSRSGALPEGADPKRLIALTCDVTDFAAGRAAVNAFAQRAGGIAGLVNNAGRHPEDTPAAELAPGDLLRVFEANCAAPLALAQAARPYLAEANGTIVGIGSFFDKLGAPRSLAYSASKAALASIDRTLAVEWGRDGISVFTVAPGYVLTDLNADWLASSDVRAKVERRIPAGRVAGAGEIGRLVAALLLEDIGFLTGETIYVDGGQGVRV
jgi:NAD(P)-dependent dehydrogenase (short-subunit alcohol dehydrogenase family)